MRRNGLLEAGCKSVRKEDDKGTEKLHVQYKRKKEIFLGRLFREFETLTPLGISGLNISGLYIWPLYLALNICLQYIWSHAIFNLAETKCCQEIRYYLPMAMNRIIMFIAGRNSLHLWTECVTEGCGRQTNSTSHLFEDTPDRLDYMNGLILR